MGLGVTSRIVGSLDDQTVIKVTDGTVDVVSEGNWTLIAPGHSGAKGFARILGIQLARRTV